MTTGADFLRAPAELRRGAFMENVRALSRQLRRDCGLPPLPLPRLQQRGSSWTCKSLVDDVLVLGAGDSEIDAFTDWKDRYDATHPAAPQPGYPRPRPAAGRGGEGGPGPQSTQGAG